MVYKFFNRSEGEIKNHVMEYLRLINADEKEHPEEVKKLIEIAEKNGMRGQDIKTLMADIDKDKIKTPQNDDERFDQLLYLINLVVGDAMLDASEFDFCIEVGRLLGYNPLRVPQIVKAMYNGIKYEEPSHEIREKVDELLK